MAELPPERWGYTRIGALRERPGADVLRDGNVMSSRIPATSISGDFT